MNVPLNDIKKLKSSDERDRSLVQLSRNTSNPLRVSGALISKFLLTMAHQSFKETPTLGLDLFPIPSPVDQPLAYVVVVFLFLLTIYSTGQKRADVPELNPPKSRLRLPGIVSAQQTQNFIRHGQDLVKAGRAKFPDQPYRLYSYVGDAVMLPPKFINEIRNEKALDFRISFQKGSRST